MRGELASAGLLLVSRQQLVVALKEGNIPKDVVLALFTNVNGMAKVSERGTNHIRRQDVPQLEFLPFLVVGSFQVDRGLGWHFGI